MRGGLFLLAVAIGTAAVPAAAQSWRTAEPGWIGVDAGLIVAPGVRPIVVVRQVAEGSPAAEAGLAPGDTLVALDGMPPSRARLQALRTGLHPGDRLELTVRSGRQPRTLVVRAAPRPIDLDLGGAVRTGGAPWHVGLPVPFTGDPRAGPPPLLLRMRERELAREWVTPYLVGLDRVAGARVAPLNPGLAQYFGTERGLLVIEVAPGTPAAAARLLPGDVLLRVGDVEVDELGVLRRMVAAAPADQVVRVIVVRRGRELQLALPR